MRQSNIKRMLAYSSIAHAGYALIGVVAWADLLGDTRAFDAISWFAPLLVLAEALNEQGVIVQCSNCRRIRRKQEPVWDWVCASFCDLSVSLLRM